MPALCNQLQRWWSAKTWGERRHDAIVMAPAPDLGCPRSGSTRRTAASSAPEERLWTRLLRHPGFSTACAGIGCSGGHGRAAPGEPGAGHQSRRVERLARTRAEPVARALLKNHY